MRIGLNATAFNDRPSGARQRFVGIYGALIRQRPDWEFIIYEPTDCRATEWFDGAANVVARSTPIASSGRVQRMAKGLIYWHRAFRTDTLDLFENFVLPLVKHPTAPTVLTIHDIRALHEQTSSLNKLLRRDVFRHAFSRADRIITVSNAIRDEILSFQPMASVSTVYNGVDPAHFIRSDNAADGVRERHGLPERYILAIGHLEERKNLSLLIDAIVLLRNRGMQRPLVIVGNDGGELETLQSRIAEHRLDGLVTIIEHADDEAVRALYSGCDMLAFPSRYEGFGIPILEAMAANKPMVLADTAVFRELTLSNGLYFPVHDADAAASAIETVWNDPVERTRQSLFASDRLNDFTFDRLARQIALVYESLT